MCVDYNSTWVVDNKRSLFCDNTLAEQFSLRELYSDRCRSLHLKNVNKTIYDQLPSQAGFKQCALVMELRCEFTYLGNIGVLALAPLLPFCPALSVLNLHGVGLTSNDFTIHALLCACESCPCLQNIDLSDNNFSYNHDSVTRSLLALIETNASLQEVNLEHCGMSCSERERIAKAIKLHASREVYKVANRHVQENLPSLIKETATDEISDEIHNIEEENKSATCNHYLWCMESNEDQQVTCNCFQEQEQWEEQQQLQLCLSHTVVARENVKNDKLSRETAIGLSELQHRLYCNRHCMKEVYGCFYDWFTHQQEQEQQQQNRRSVNIECREQSSNNSNDYIGNSNNSNYNNNNYFCATGSICKSEVDQSSSIYSIDETAEGVSEESRKDSKEYLDEMPTRVSSVCSWSTFQQGLLSLRVEFVSESVERAVTFASACGLLTSDSVKINKLLFLLRPHAVLMLSKHTETKWSKLTNKMNMFVRMKELLEYNKICNMSERNTTNDIDYNLLNSKLTQLSERETEQNVKSSCCKIDRKTLIHTTTAFKEYNTNRQHRTRHEKLFYCFLCCVIRILLRHCDQNKERCTLHGWCHPNASEKLQKWLNEYEQINEGNELIKYSAKLNAMPVVWPNIMLANEFCEQLESNKVDSLLEANACNSDDTFTYKAKALSYCRLQFVVDKLYDYRNEIFATIKERAEYLHESQNNVESKAYRVEYNTFVDMCKEWTGEEYEKELQCIVQQYYCYLEKCKDMLAINDEVNNKNTESLTKTFKIPISYYRNDQDAVYIDCKAFLEEHLCLQEGNLFIPKEALYAAWRKCTSKCLQRVLSSIELS